MNTCPYCGSEVMEHSEDKFYCDFCSMILGAHMIQQDGARIPVRVREYALDAFADKTTPELMTLSTFELLRLLKDVRAERSNMYKQLKVMQQAEEQTEEFQEGTKMFGDEYESFTRKMFVVENIIRQRLGYVPKRLTDYYLDNYWKQIQGDKSQPMAIRRQPKTSVQGTDS